MFQMYAHLSNPILRQGVYCIIICFPVFMGGVCKDRPDPDLCVLKSQVMCDCSTDFSICFPKFPDLGVLSKKGIKYFIN